MATLKYEKDAGGNLFIRVMNDDATEGEVLKGVKSCSIAVIGDEDTESKLNVDIKGVQTLIDDPDIDLSVEVI